MNDREQDLVRSINKNLSTGKVSTAKLETDDRILARITDGIYRQPASALRELIANAYDADAQNVFIQTDTPRFQNISIRDDGNGLTIESLARLVNHIGGSSKRIVAGVELGVVSKKDPARSPKGRKLIGKIGIGLFSVAQLTRHFQIISKVAGTEYRLVAEVILKTYTEDDLANVPKDEEKRVETGTVRIRAVKAADRHSHGTEIVLLNLRPQTRELLQSREVWMQLGTGVVNDEEVELTEAPAFHIAGLALDNAEAVERPSELPWANEDPPESRFACLYQGVLDRVSDNRSNIKLETILDNYLRTLWTLSLSAPIDYIEKHPFDLSVEDGLSTFVLSNEPRGQADRLKLKKGQTVRSALGLTAPERGSALPFRVFVDDVQLKRPIRYTDLPQTANAITSPLIFFGKASPDLSKIDPEERGGDLEFEAYLIWTPKVVPREHNGVLIRISDASGTLFDETFMRYQTAEQVRLRQITAEIFVKKGLDAALNIDRESFNYAHPHYQYVMRWLHRALRQLANSQKKLGSDIRASKSESEHKRQVSGIQKTVRSKLKGLVAVSEIPSVVFDDDTKKLSAHRKSGKLAFLSSVVFADAPIVKRGTASERERQQLEAKTIAVAQILEAYGVFEDMTYQKQQQLLQAIVAVFVKEGD